MRWDAVLRAVGSTAAVDPVLSGIFGEAGIRLASASNPHRVPVLEFSPTSDGPEGELWDPVVVQFDIFHADMTRLRQAERRLRLLFHAELPVTIAGVGMWAQCTEGAPLETPSRDNYYGRGVRFQFTPLREIYDRSGTPAGTPGGPPASLPDIEPTPPIFVPEPPIDPPIEPPPDGLLFIDGYEGGQKAGAQNGVSYGGINTHPTDAVTVVADPDNASGYALGFFFDQDISLAADAWAEQRLKFPDLTPKAYIGMRVRTEPTYRHRNATGADNNKLLRLWDEQYGPTGSQPTWGSIVHVGLSTLPKNDGSGTSLLIIEYKKYGDATGNFGLGPWTPVFAPGTVTDIGLEVTLASGVGVADGRIRLWVNDILVKDAPGLMLCNNPAGPPAKANVIRNGYAFGWSNSGFSEDTLMRLERLIVAPERIEV